MLPGPSVGFKLIDLEFARVLQCKFILLFIGCITIVTYDYNMGCFSLLSSMSDAFATTTTIAIIDDSKLDIPSIPNRQFHCYTL